MKKLWNRKRALLVVSAMVLLDCPAWGQGEQRSSSPGGREAAPAAPPSRASEQRTKKIGAPQVIEIPLPEPPPPVPSPSWQEDLGEQSNQNAPLAVPSRTARFSRPGYLGVLYATAEDGLAGVRVLDVIADSPAERAGFSSQFLTRTDKVLLAAIIVLAFTPVGPFAIPLASALNPSYNQAPRRDLIVAVDGQSVSNAQEFNDIMRRFGPGDTVTFVVQRGTTHVHLSAQLEAEPQ